MKIRIWTYLVFIFLTVFTGCLKNDLPYPRIQQNIKEISVYGQSRNATIDSTSLIATVYLEEWINPAKITFDEFKVSEGGIAEPNLSEGEYDLTNPITVDITLYQTYQWTVAASQNIARYVTVEGQVGESIIDVAARRVIINVPDTYNTSSLTLTSFKLGPDKATIYNPVMVTGQKYNFSTPFVVAVEYFDKTEDWTIYVQKVESTVGTERVDAWSMVIWAYGTCSSESAGTFQYKKSTDLVWHDIDPAWLTQNTGTFSAYIPHLQPLTEYVVRAVSDGETGNEITVTTAETADLPDGAFDQWWLNGKVWCPWNEGGTPYWDTGNRGAAVLGQSNVKPTEHTVTGSGQAAELTTKYMVVKLAAGSIYTGSFKQIDGTNGILDFGRPFNLRPTKLRGYYQYQTAIIDKSNSEMKDLIGRPDSCHIYVALTDWTAPYEIRTNPNNRQLFDKNADYIIGYGELIYSGTMDNYQPFEIKIDYRNTWQVPTYLQITCAASKYGDYFTGGVGAVLYVDEFSFDYDY